ncbi:hypothetical protein AB0M57_24995 [Streptomyces sp. NPDC051597]|uniref:hypothetical protein n=1 Tax=Streptomyces sp. NPDC051597 TaxID=3155049 RepID=UPI00341D4857
MTVKPSPPTPVEPAEAYGAGPGGSPRPGPAAGAAHPAHAAPAPSAVAHPLDSGTGRTDLCTDLAARARPPLPQECVRP